MVVSGAPNATTTVKGIVQLATAAQTQAGTATGSTGAALVPPNSLLATTSAGAGSAGVVPVLGAAGLLDSSFLPVVSIAKGGTGQATKTLGFNALSPQTTKGDLITNDGTNDVRIGVGADTSILIADSSQTDGIRWGTIQSSGAVQSFIKSVTPVTMTDTVVETTLITFTVPGGTLGTTGILKGRLIIDSWGTQTAGTTVTFKLKYGGTTVATCVLTPDVGANASAWGEMALIAKGLTGTQIGQMFMLGGGFGNTPTIAKATSTNQSTITVDSTINQTLLLTATYSAATTSSDTLTMAQYSFTLE